MEIIETSAKEETKKGKKKQNNNRNFNQIFTGENILAEYADFNIFGAVVTYPYLISFLAISSIIIISLVYNNFARKQKIA